MKSFFLRSILFVALLLGVQAAVALAYPPNIPTEILEFEALLRERADVLYFGDSTLWYPRGAETTPQILQTLLPDQTVGEVSHAAYGFEVYHAYAEAAARELEAGGDAQAPAWVVLPVNMRSFSPEWNLRPGYQFVEEQTVLRWACRSRALSPARSTSSAALMPTLPKTSFWQPPFTATPRPWATWPSSRR